MCSATWMNLTLIRYILCNLTMSYYILVVRFLDRRYRIKNLN